MFVRWCYFWSGSEGVEEDVDEGFFSSSSFIASLKSASTSLVARLNSFIDFPKPRANSGKRFAPKSSNAIRKMKIHSDGPGIPKAKNVFIIIAKI